MDKKTQKKYVDLCNSIKESVKRWNIVNEQGTTDPAWTDGVNMNLVRNHIIYRKRQLKVLCTENNLPIPIIAKVNVPPEVDPDYMCITPNLSEEKFRHRCSLISTTSVFKFKDRYDYTMYSLKVRRKRVCRLKDQLK